MRNKGKDSVQKPKLQVQIKKYLFGKAKFNKGQNKKRLKVPVSFKFSVNISVWVCEPVLINLENDILF